MIRCVILGCQNSFTDNEFCRNVISKNGSTGLIVMIRFILFCLASLLTYSAVVLAATAETVVDFAIRPDGRSTELVLFSDAPLKRQILYQGSAISPVIVVSLPDVVWEMQRDRDIRKSNIRKLVWIKDALVIKLRQPQSANVLEFRPNEKDSRYQTVLSLRSIAPEDFNDLVENYKQILESKQLSNLYNLISHAPRPLIKPAQNSSLVSTDDSLDTAITVTETDEAIGNDSEDVEQAVTTIIPQFLKVQSEDSRKIIVIDPGHGGKDPGTSQHGAIEKDIVLDVAMKMKDILVNNEDYIVYLTRDGDEFIGLEERLTFARDMNANIFISLHADAAESPVASGASVFTLSPQGLQRSEDMIQTNNWTLHGNLAVDEPSNSVLDDLWKRQTKSLSPILAEKVIDEFKEIIPMVDYPLRNASYYVLLDLKAPAVLVELGYLTNILDARRLISSESRSQAAEAITRAIKSYFEYYDTLGSTE